MAVFVKSMSGKKARDLIVDRLTKNQAKPAGERKITTWEYKKEGTTHCLYHRSENFGQCGHFELHVLKDEPHDELKIALRVKPEHHGKGDKWPALIGALHGELIQLLLNHFEELVLLDGKGVQVVRSVLKRVEK